MRSWSSTRALAAALLAVALPVLATPAAASADGFTPIERIGASTPLSPRVAADPSGRSVLAWRDGTTLRVATRAPGGALSAPHTLGTSSIAPQVAVSDDGTAFVGYAEGSNLMLAVRPPGGSWTTSVVGTFAAPAFSLAVARDGTANVLWADTTALHLVTRSPGGSLTTPAAPAIALPPGATLSGAVLAAGADGELVAAWAWSQFDAMSMMTTNRLDAARRTGGTWSATQQIDSLTAMLATTIGSLAPLAITMSPAKAAVVAWSTSQGMVGLPTTTTLKLAWAPAGGAFEDADAVLDSATGIMGISTATLDGLALAFDGERAVAAWRQAASQLAPPMSSTSIRTRSRAAGPGESVSDLTEVLTSTADAVGAPALTARPDSGPFLAVPRPNGLAVAAAPAGGGLGTAASLLTGFTAPPEASAAGAGAGDAVVALTSAAGSEPFAGLSVFDTGAPVLSAVDVPASGTTAAPVAVSATATDRWQPPTQTWDFGDGATATGASVSHQYAAPGAYTVKAGAHDATANVASAQERAIVITTPPPLGGGDPAGGDQSGGSPAGGGAPGGGTTGGEPGAVGDGLTRTTFATAAFKGLRGKPAANRGFGTVQLACATKAGCRATITVVSAKGRRVTLATKATARVAGASRRAVALRLSPAGLRALRKAGRLSVRITVKLSDPTGRQREIRRTLRLTAPKR